MTFIYEAEDTYTPAEFQLEDLEYLQTREKSANWSEMGCLSGDATITVLSSGGKVSYWSLREAYLGFNKLHDDKRKWWKSNKPYKTLALVDGRIRHHEIEAITYSGVKWCIELCLEDGRSVRLTPDHEVLTADDEWVEAQSLTVGDYIRVLGGKGRKHDADPSSYKYVKIGNKYEREHRVVNETPSDLLTHHVDEQKRHNNPENLTSITLEDHSRLHAKDQIASYDAPPMRVVAIQELGAIPTYDISMKAPYHNFVANGVVVHNCYKTSTILWLIERLHRDAEIENPLVLIVTTKSGKGTYYDAVPKCLNGWQTYNADVKDTKLVFHGLELPVTLDDVKPTEPTIVVAHYQCFSGHRKKDPKDQRKDSTKLFFKWALKQPWTMVVLDEAHRIKNRKGAWTHNIKDLANECKVPMRHVMTGTGFINRPDELWSLLNFLDKKTYGSYWTFRETFCEEEVDDAGFSHVIGLNPNNKELYRRMVRTIGPRRTKKEVFPNLPHPIFSPMPVDLNPTQRKMYDDIKTTLRTLDQAGEPIHSPNVLSMLNRLRQITVATPQIVGDRYDDKQERRVQEIRLVEPSSKLDALMEIIEGLEWDEERRDQLVVFSNFKDPIELAKTRFDKAGITYLHMQQSDNDATRYKKWHDLFPQKRHQVFISTLQLGSESINLTPATTCVFLDRSWSPKDNEQGVARVWRPGQEDVANIVHLNARNTTDQYVEQVNERKLGWFREIFANEEDM
jgi:hypothetical protein